MEFFNLMSPLPFEDFIRQKVLDKIRKIANLLWPLCKVK